MKFFQCDTIFEHDHGDGTSKQKINLSWLFETSTYEKQEIEEENQIF